MQKKTLRHSIAATLLVTGIFPSGYYHVSAQGRPTAEEVTIEKKLIEGEKYTFLGEWEKAEPIYRAILEEDVQNSAACYQLSRTLMALGKSADALDYIRKAVRIEPDNEWYLLMEADIHEKIGDLASTMDVYDRLILLKPKKPQYYEMLIGLCKRTGSSDRLLRTLDRYETLVGVSESITRTRFETLDGLGRTQEAMASIHRLTEVYPLNLEYKYLAAAYARKIGDEERALGYYRKILELSPEDSRAKLALANSIKKEGDEAGYLQSILPIISNPSIELDIKLEELIPFVVDYSKSKETALGDALRSVILKLETAHPREAKVFAMKGDICAIAGNTQDAIAAYTRATELNDNVYAVWEQLIALLLQQREYEALIAQADKAINIFPNQGYLYYASGYGHYKKKELKDAQDMLSQALVMTGRNAGQKINVLNLLGMVYDEMGDVDKSVAAFESSIALNPRHPETLAYYALTLSKRIVRSDRAIEMADRVAEGQTAGYLHQILAEVYYNQGQYTRANQSMQIALGDRIDGPGYNLAGDIQLKLGNKSEAVTLWQKAVDAGYKVDAIRQKIEDNKSQ